MAALIFFLFCSPLWFALLASAQQRLCPSNSVAPIPLEDGIEVVSSRWMGDLKGYIGNLTLQQMTIPGTHDSGSYNMSDILIGVPEYLDVMVEVADALGVPVGQIIDGWSKSQDQDLFGQYCGGIRYIDMRICWYGPNNTWHTHHGAVLGNVLQQLLNDTRDFLESYPDEVLVIDMTHDQGGASGADMDMLGDMLQSTLGSFLYPRANGFNMTTSQMVASGQRLLLSCDDTDLVDPRPWLWYGSVIINSYADSPILETMESFNLGMLEDFAAHGKFFDGQLYLMSWTLTPNADTIFNMVLPDHPKTLIELANTANADLSGWYGRLPANDTATYPILGNVLIIDHFETSNIATLLLPPLSNLLH